MLNEILNILKMKKIFIAYLLLCLCIVIHAQVPGYLGKRYVVEVQVMSPIIDVFSFSSFPVIFKVHGEYAIKRNRSISLDYRQVSRSEYGTKYDSKAFVAMYGFYLKEWTLAPYGKYINLGLGYNMRHYTTLDKTVAIQNYNFLSFQLNWGNRIILAKSIALNYGFDIGIPLNTKFINIDSHRADLNLMLFNINLGVGYIF